MRYVILLIVSAILLVALPAAAAEWYVNDADTTGDIWCSAPGDTANSGTSPVSPLATITAAQALASAGDTLYIDAGTYVNVSLISSSLSLVGADTMLTIIDRGDTLDTSVIGIAATGTAGVYLSDLTVRHCFRGVELTNAVAPTLLRIRVEECGNDSDGAGVWVSGSSTMALTAVVAESCYRGIVLDSATAGTLSQCVVRNSVADGFSLVNFANNNLLSGCRAISNGGDGFAVGMNANYNTLTECTADSNAGAGVFLSMCMYTQVLASSATGNDIAGFSLDTADGNRLAHNRASDNNGTLAAVGFRLSGGSSNRLEQNRADSNAAAALSIVSFSSNEILRKNHFAGSAAQPDSVVNNSVAATIDLRYTWWGTTDSSVIAAGLSGSGVDYLQWVPYRLGPIDTAPGADTVAPSAPDSVTATALDSATILVSWSTSLTNEESTPLAVNLAGYRIYRAVSASPASWQQVGQSAAGVETFVDTTVANDNYYYRVTAYDSASPYVNESWFSDSIAVASTMLDVSGPNVWYVNDADTTGDYYCSVPGNDSNTGLSGATPKLTIAAVTALLSAGDTIYLDRGTYSETVAIDTDNIVVMGVDTTTVIAWADTTVAGGSVINVAGRNNLMLMSLCVRGGYNGIALTGAQDASLYDLVVEQSGNVGIIMQSGSDYASLSASVVQNIGDVGVSVTNCTGVCVITTDVTNTGNDGIAFSGVVNGTIEENTVTSSGSNGIGLYAASTNNSICTNIVNGSTEVGLAVSYSPVNLVAGNALSGNAYGMMFEVADGCIVQGNMSGYNTYAGLVDTGSSGNSYYANAFAGNTQLAQIYLAGNSSGCTFAANNIGVGADTRAMVEAGCAPQFQRNWWGTANESQIAASIVGAGAGAVNWTPYRLNEADTTPGADTVSPAPPAGLTADTATPGQILLTWNGVTINEDGTVCSDLLLYRVYRADTSPDNWKTMLRTSTGTDTFYTDTMVSGGMTYHYRVTAVDSVVPFENESFFGDTLTVTAGAGVGGGPDTPSVDFTLANWVTDPAVYSVGDTAYIDLAYDSGNLLPGVSETFTVYVVNLSNGNDSEVLLLLEAGPDSGDFRGALLLTGTPDSGAANGALYVTAGDTLEVRTTAVVDSTTLTDQVTIAAAVDTSGPNVWYFNDSDTTGDYYCSAPGSDANSGLSPDKPLRTLNALTTLLTNGDSVYVDAGTYDSVAFTIGANDVFLQGVDSTATVFTGNPAAYIITATGRAGLDLRDFGCTGSSNGYAIYCDNVDSSWFQNLRIVNGNGHGIYLYNGSSGNIVAGNYCDTMGGSGIHLHTSSTGNTISGNTVRNCSTGGAIYLVNSNNNVISTNAVFTGTYGINLYGSDACTVTNNVVIGSQTGLYLQNGSDSCTIDGNDFIGSSNYGISVDAISNGSNVFTANAVHSGGSYALYALSGNGNLYMGNEFRGNAGGGVYLTGNSGTILQNNRIANNTLTGIELFGTQSVYVRLNDIDSNGNNQVLISGAATTASITFNNIITSPGNPDSGISNPAAATVTATRNWWGSVDSGAAKVSGAGITAEPWRLNVIDTTPGADTVAPEPPSVVTCTGGVNTIEVGWTASLYEENGTFHGGGGVAGYQIWRSLNGTETWSTIAQVGAGVLQYTDTGLADSITAWYQVLSYDSHTPYANVGWADTMASATTASVSETIVLEFYNAGFTVPAGSYAVGDTAYLQLDAASANIDSGAYDSVALRVLNQNTGDSDWVIVVETGMTSGVFRGEFQIVASDSTLYNSRLQADSGHLVIADTGAAGQATDSVQVVDSTSTAGPNAWYVNDTDITGDVYCSAAGDSGNSGLSPTSPHLSLAYVLAQVDDGDTVFIDAGQYFGYWQATNVGYLTLLGVDSAATVLHVSGAFDGLTLSGCTGAQLASFAVTEAMGGYNGIVLTASPQSLLYQIDASGNGLAGIELQGGCDNTYISECSAEDNGNQGVVLASCNEVTVYQLTARNNQYGIAATGSTRLAVYSCLLDSNSMNGIDLPAGCDSAAIGENVISSNGNCGISGAPGAEIIDNTFTGNAKGIDAGQSTHISGNLFTGNGYGLYVLTSSVHAELNEFSGNQSAGVYLTGTPSGFLARRNNLAGDDTAVLCTASGSHLMSRNWWGTTDSAAVSARITGGMSYNVVYTPYRFYPIDTTSAADTIAPAAPDTSAAYGLDTETVRLSWAAVTDEEDSLGVCGDLSGYGIWQRAGSDTQWSYVTATGAGTEYYDIGTLSTGIPYWFAVTAFDGASPYPNESWYSSAAQVTLLPDTTGPNVWYVNDASPAGDIYCSAIGSNANSGLAADQPKLDLSAVFPLLTTGDTVYVDNGSHTANASIPLSGVAIVGAGSSVTTLNGWLAADTKSSVYLADFCVAYGGISLYNVTNSTITGVQATWCDIGIWVIGGSGNTITGCLGMDDTVGIQLDGSAGNRLIGNSMNLGFGSGYVLTGSSNNLLMGNSAQGNTLYGFSDSQGVGNIFTANDAYGNGTQYAQSGTNSNTWRKNNLAGGSGVYSDAAAAPLDFTQNWWSTGDTSVIESMRSGPGANGIVFSPFRLSVVDTTPGADTVAPQQVTGVLLTGNDTSVTVQWDYPSLDEEGDVLSDLAGYRIWYSTGGAWTLAGDAPDYATDFEDTTASHAVGRYYRVSAYDNATLANVGWYSATAGPSAPNRAPVAVITGDSIAGTDSLSLSAAASGDSDADGLSYYWWIDVGTPGTLTSPNSITTTCTGMAAGWYAFGLAVSDSYGGSDTTYHYVDVYDATVPDTPTLSINWDDLYTTSETVTLSISPVPGQEAYAYYMKIGTDPALTTGSWEPYDYTKEWEITGGDGDRYLYVALGNMFYAQSGVAVDSINLDRVAPAGVTITPDTTVVTDPENTPVNLTFATSDSTATVTMRFADALYVEGWYWDVWTDSAQHWLDPYGDTQQTVVLQVQDAAGNIATDSVMLTITASNFPQPPSGFYGYGNDSAGAELFWSGSFSTNVTAYSIYSDSATGTMNYAVPVAVLGSAARSYTVSGLVPDTMYTFGIRATDSEGDTEQNTDVLTWIYAYTTPPADRVYALVDYPIPGLSINGIVPMQAWVDGDLSGGAEVSFRYRSAGTTNPWTYVGGIVDSPPYMTSWNTTGLADGDYELQAVAFRKSNHADTDPYPSSVIITKSAANASISQTITTDGDTLMVQKLNSNATDTQQIVAGSEDDPLEVQVPPGILGSNASISVKLFTDTADALMGVDRTEFETGCTVIDVNFSNSQTTFNDSIVMRIPYDDANNDGIVDGTGIRVYLLRILYFSTTYNAWRVVPKADMTIDTANKTITVRVSHFSKFATGKVTLGGDLGSNSDGIGDGQVNNSDLARFNTAFGARSGNPHFNDAANIVRTGASANRVDEEDVFQMGANYGTSQ